MEYKVGSIVFVHGNGFFDRLIQFGQTLRYPQKDYYWNHVAVIVSPDGDMIEALGSGVKRTNIGKYINSEYPSGARIVELSLSPEDQQELVQFATYCLSDGYGWTTIVSTAFCLLFGLKFSFGFSGEDICSGLVARALEHAGRVLAVDATHCTPAELAQLFLT